MICHLLLTAGIENLFLSFITSGRFLSSLITAVTKNGLFSSIISCALWGWSSWSGNDYDYGRGLAVDSSNNVYLVGTTSSFGAGLYDMALVKYDSSGVQQWNRTWGGSNYDYGSGVAVDSLNNMYLAGDTLSFGAGSRDMVLVKFGETREKGLAISGYDLLLFTFVIGVITAISLHKKYNK